MLKDFTIPGSNRVALSPSLASELKLHKQKSRDHMFELYLLAAGIRDQYLNPKNGNYSDDFTTWYRHESLKDVFGELPNFTKYAFCGNVISFVALNSEYSKDYLNQLPVSLTALYEVHHIATRHPEALKVCFHFTPRRKSLSAPKPKWVTKNTEALIHPEVAARDLKNWIDAWEDPKQAALVKPKDKFRRTVKLLTVSVSEDIFGFDEVGNKTGTVDLPELHSLLAQLQTMFSKHNEKQFLLETEIDAISEKYIAKKDKLDPAKNIKSLVKTNRARSYKNEE
jgi:hypothetical protein